MAMAREIQDKARQDGLRRLQRPSMSRVCRDHRIPPYFVGNKHSTPWRTRPRFAVGLNVSRFTALARRAARSSAQ